MIYSAQFHAGIIMAIVFLESILYPRKPCEIRVEFNALSESLIDGPDHSGEIRIIMTAQPAASFYHRQPSLNIIPHALMIMRRVNENEIEITGIEKPTASALNFLITRNRPSNCRTASIAAAWLSSHFS